ncbi:RNA-binding protein [Pararhodobacter sp. CCB-MM2]|uniref:RNA-binding protein n=1 Tax=Pararhodobacter sp. CCB-MM2 TaxID=1786003 RepID=UPI00083317FA|nr:RNA-binding protein [Pararhodobacter sp. CCB-MM2]MCA2011776.1 RNA-binding protein [Cereibacter sphaeroides]
MTRGGRAKDSDGPDRRCIVTGEVQPKGGLIRFVVGPDAGIVPDIEGKLPGRGIYVSADRAAIAQAAKRKLFARAARAPVTVPEGLEDLVHDLQTRRVIELLALGRKAGQAVAGYEKVRDWLNTESAEVLIQASDGSARGKTKLRAPDGEDSYIGCLSAGEIGLAFGREHVIHAALAAGGLSARVVEEAAKLARLRGQNDGTDAIGED